MMNHTTHYKADDALPKAGGGFLARKKGRQYAMQALYGWQMTENPLALIETDMLTMHAAEIWDREYFHALLFGVPEHQAEIIAHLSPHLIDRSVTELDPIEFNILRIAVYELLFRWDVPYRVVINEAVELAKKFGATDGHKFVNAVLDKIVLTLPGRDQT
jgi:transcription antitermination protein NusB